MAFIKFDARDKDARAMYQKSGVRRIPTMVFYKDGKQKSKLLGNLPKDKIVAELKKITE